MMEILSGLVGFIGVLTGGLVATVVPWIRDSIRERGLRSERANYLAARVVSAFDMFVLECQRIVVQRVLVEKGGYLFEDAIPREIIYSIAPREPLPTLPQFPDDIDWKSIDSKLVYKIFRLQNRIRISIGATKRTEDEITVPLEDYSYFYEARWYSYSGVGLEAIEIIAKLVEQHRISEENQNAVIGLNQKQLFLDTKREIEKSREGRPGWEQKLNQQILDAMKKHKKSGNPVPQPNKDEGES